MHFLFEAKMTLGQVLNRVRKLVDLAKDKAVINNAYFNPNYAERLFEKIPELKSLGFRSETTETESEDGKIISAKILSPMGNELDLGSLLLTGKEVVVQRSLQTLDDIIEFIEEEARQEVQTEVNF